MSSTDEQGNEIGKLFVGGLHQTTVNESLKSYFNQFGEVAEASVMMDHKTGRSRGFGYVKFADSESVIKVINQSKHSLDGKEIDPKPCNVNMKGKSRRLLKIFVGGVAPEHNEETLREFFSQFGNLTELTLMKDPSGHRHRGFAFVGYDDEQVVKQLIADHYLTIGNKQVEIKQMEQQLNRTTNQLMGGGGSSFLGHTSMASNIPMDMGGVLGLTMSHNNKRNNTNNNNNSINNTNNNGHGIALTSPLHTAAAGNHHWQQQHQWPHHNNISNATSWPTNQNSHNSQWTNANSGGANSWSTNSAGGWGGGSSNQGGGHGNIVAAAAAGGGIWDHSPWAGLHNNGGGGGGGGGGSTAAWDSWSAPGPHPHQAASWDAPATAWMTHSQHHHPPSQHHHPPSQHITTHNYNNNTAAAATGPQLHNINTQSAQHNPTTIHTNTPPQPHNFKR